jgi:hypothetical protein
MIWNAASMDSSDHNWVRVSGDILIRGDAIVLSSPDEYDPGPRGIVHQPVIQWARLELDVPAWYVRPDDQVGMTAESDVPDKRAIRTFGVGRNPDEGTVLEAIGRVNDPSMS